MNQSSRTILIVDDSPEDRELYRRYLLRDQEHSYTILEATLGQQGLELWQQHQPDAVLLDYRLPDMDGLEFLAQPYLSPQPSCFPVIMVTGQGNEAIAVQAIKAGAQDYLVKEQITPEGLHLAVNGAVETVQLRTQLHQRIERERLVAQITQKIYQTLDLEEILQTTVEEVRQFLQTDRVFMYRFQPDFGGTVVVESVGDHWLPILGATVEDPYLMETWGEDYRQERTQVVADIYAAGLTECQVDRLAQFQIRANLVVPILHDEALWGLLVANHCSAPREWQPLEINLIQQLTIQVGIALQQAELYQQAQNELSERKQAEFALRQTTERLNVALKSAPLTLFNQDLELRYTWVYNPTHDYSMQEVIGLRDEDLVSPDTAAHLTHLKRQVLETGVGLREEVQVTSKGQMAYYDLTIDPIWDSQNTMIGITCAAVDITERKQIEVTLQERSEQVRLLYETTRDLLSSTQPLDLVETVFNRLKAPLELDVYFNYMLDKQHQKFHLTSYSGIAQDVAQQMEWLDTGQIVCDTVALPPFQIVQTNGQGSSHPQTQLARSLGITACACQPLIAQGKLFGTLSFASRRRTQFTASEQSLFQAISDQIAIALERSDLLTSLQQQTEELLRTNRIKDEFLAVLSHELRSPLNPILGWARMLQICKFDDAKTAEALATIERNARLQTQLIDDLLDIAKILRGKLSMNVAPVNLVFVVEAAIDTVKTAAIAKSIHLHPVLPPVGQVSGDPTRLQQIVWNLLSNAIKFTPEHGRVDIRLERVGNQAQITVSDTGIGIRPDFLPHIFESFRQEDASTTRRFGGLGLGLAIVYSLVEAHGGTIAADSQGEDQGATFTVRIPLLNTRPEQTQTEEISEPNLNLTGIRILTVDDELDTRKLLTAVLSRYGAEVLTAASATEALANLALFQPNVLISDIGMPEVDGYSLIRQVRTLPPEQGGQIPAIALTAYAREDDHQQAIISGYQWHMTKPIVPEQLVKAVMALTQTQSSRNRTLH